MILLEGKFYFIQIVMSRVNTVQFQLFSITKKSERGRIKDKKHHSEESPLFSTLISPPKF